MLTEAEFLQFENLRARFLEEVVAAGFTGQHLLNLQLETVNFVHKLVVAAAAVTPTPVAVTPPVVTPPVPAPQVF